MDHASKEHVNIKTDPKDNNDYQPLLEELETRIQVNFEELKDDLSNTLANFNSNEFSEDEKRTMKNIQDACALSFEKMLEVSKSHLTEIVEILQSKENRKRIHMRSHYDRKLIICRVSNRLEREHNLNQSRVEAFDIGEEMNAYYKERIDETNAKLELCETMRQVQDKTLDESRQILKRTQQNLRCTVDEYTEYKNAQEDKCTKLNDQLNLKRKQEVWAHFKISHLKKKAKISDRALCLKKKECKTKQVEIKELQSRLQRSMEIREGLERAFERRASIRGRIDILNENNKLQKGRPCTKQKIRQVCLDKGTQAFLSRGHEMKDQGLDSPPFYTDELGKLKRTKEDAEHLLHISNQKKDYALKQNEAYRGLMSGKGLAMILATKHRELSSNPKSLDAKILYDLTRPQGILNEKQSQPNEQVEMLHAKVPISRQPEKRDPIKSSEIVSFGDILGTQTIYPQGSSNEDEEHSQSIQSVEKARTIPTNCKRKPEMTLSIPKISKLESFGGILGTQIDTRTEIR